MSREDHRAHDELLLVKRALEKETTQQKAKRKRKEKRDLAAAVKLTIAGIVATVFLKIVVAGALGVFGFVAFCGYVANMEWAVEVSIYKVRLLQGTILVVGIFLESIALYPYWRQEKALLTDGDLLGGSSQIFTDNIIRTVPILKMGNGENPSGIIMVPKSPQQLEPYFEFFPDSVVKLEPGKRGPIVSTVVRDRFGNKVVEIEKNHWKVYPPYCSDKNYTDSALEALDTSGHVLLQLRILPSYVLVNGEWWDNEGHGRRIVPAAEGGALVITLGPMVQHNESLIKPMFKYPSSEHWGDFDN